MPNLGETTEVQASWAVGFIVVTTPAASVVMMRVLAAPSRTRPRRSWSRCVWRMANRRAIFVSTEVARSCSAATWSRVHSRGTESNTQSAPRVSPVGACTGIPT